MPKYGAVPVVALVGILAGCGSGGEVVATLVDEESMVDGYFNQATADYAECLEGLGIVVSPERDTEANNLVGYVKIAGATFSSDDSGGVLDDPDTPIAVDGEDRDLDVRGCYDASPGAKDSLIDMHDFVAVHEGAEILEGDVAAGIVWARCARGIGISEISDPNRDGYVVIPESVTLEQAESLGEECSAPMAEDEYWPQFKVLAGVKDPETGMVDLTPVAEMIDAPFLESDRAKKYREENPDQIPVE